MIDLARLVGENAAALTDGTLLPTGSVDHRAIAYHVGVLPPRHPGTEITAVMPFCLVKIGQFSFVPTRTVTIELVYALHNDDRDAALDDLQTLAELLSPLAERGRKWGIWKPSEFTGHSGDKDTGNQPHPHYYMTFSLTFVRAKL